MKVKTLLAQASKCVSEADAQKLLETLEHVFGNAGPVAHLPQNNSEAYMEEANEPNVSFELNRVISEHYITMIRPEIRHGKMVVVVVTNRMLDGLGMSSKSWETEKDMDEIIEPDGDRTMTDVAKQAMQLAIANHAQLIERVGVPQALALKAAKKSW